MPVVRCVESVMGGSLQGQWQVDRWLKAVRRRCVCIHEAEQGGRRTLAGASYAGHVHAASLHAQSSA